jgi:hypothetical protein
VLDAGDGGEVEHVVVARLALAGPAEEVAALLARAPGSAVHGDADCATQREHVMLGKRSCGHAWPCVTNCMLRWWVCPWAGQPQADVEARAVETTCK